MDEAGARAYQVSKERRTTEQGEVYVTKLLIPLDGSRTAEKALPYARFLAQDKNVAIELLAVVDVATIATHMTADQAHHLDTMVQDAVRRSEKYLQTIAGTLTAARSIPWLKPGDPKK